MGRNKLSIKKRWLENAWEKEFNSLNILYTKEKEILPAYISKHKWTCEKQITLLMIPKKEKESSDYLAVKILSTLLREITSKHGDFYCLNCLHSFKMENRLRSHEKK